jgi:hypothetical protein
VNALKLFYLTLQQLLKQVRHLPESIAQAARQRREQAVRDECEVERLDRIRNPSKYRGK